MRPSFSLSCLGAIFVPINLALRGKVLERVITSSVSKSIVCQTQLVERLTTIECGALALIVEVGGVSPSGILLERRDEGALRADSKNFPLPDPEVEPCDVGAILYTSGTTGPSKGVRCPHLLSYTTGVLSPHFLGECDRFLLNLTYGHMGGLLVAYAMLDCRGSFAVVSDFRTQEFWRQVRTLGATSCYLLGPMVNFPMKQPRLPGETVGFVPAT